MAKKAASAKNPVKKSAKKTGAESTPKKKSAPSQPAKAVALTAAKAEYALSVSERTKIKKLLRTKTLEGVTLGLTLLKSTAATPADWEAIFTPQICTSLLNSWVPEIWELVAKSLKSFPALMKSFEKVAVTRLLTRHSDKGGRDFIEAVVPELQPELADLFGDFFANYPHLLSLSITKLSDHAAESLSKLKFGLYLDDLTTLSDRAAESLAKIKGFLILDNLTTLSDEASESLAKHKGVQLNLNGLATVSDSVAKSLANYDGELLLRGVTTLSDSVAKSLGNNNLALSLDLWLSHNGAVCRPAFVKRWSAAKRPRAFMEFISIPAGSFTMGSPEKEKGRFNNEKQVGVTITRAFELGKTVVTQKQWTEVMGTDSWNWENLKETGDNYPAVNVSWLDASLFCEHLTSYEREAGRLSANQTYRLPTEAEWEHACRAGTTTAYSFGDDESSLKKYAWYDRNSRNKLHEVATKKPNPWGLFDMHGNVREWCEDWHEESLSGGNDPKGPSAGSYRVFRGGNWYYDGPSDCRSAYRSYCHPTIRHGTLGFRIVRVLL